MEISLIYDWPTFKPIISSLSVVCLYWLRSRSLSNDLKKEIISGSDTDLNILAYVRIKSYQKVQVILRWSLRIFWSIYFNFNLLNVELLYLNKYNLKWDLIQKMFYSNYTQFFYVPKLQTSAIIGLSKSVFSRYLCMN